MSANPIYHLKDAYFFEVPKSLWRYDWKSLSEVPSFLTDAHPDITDVNEFNRALDGKVLIPQPFAELHSLYAPKSGFAVPENSSLGEGSQAKSTPTLDVTSPDTSSAVADAKGITDTWARGCTPSTSNSFSADTKREDDCG